MSTTKFETKGDWLQSWDPEDPQKWDSRLAWNTLTITTFTLTLAFVAWFLPSAIVPKLNALGFDFTIVTTAESDKEASELLTLLGFPFRNS